MLSFNINALKRHLQINRRKNSIYFAEKSRKSLIYVQELVAKQYMLQALVLSITQSRQSRFSLHQSKLPKEAYQVNRCHIQ